MDPNADRPYDDRPVSHRPYHDYHDFDIEPPLGGDDLGRWLAPVIVGVFVVVALVVVLFAVSTG